MPIMSVRRPRAPDQLQFEEVEFVRFEKMLGVPDHYHCLASADGDGVQPHGVERHTDSPDAAPLAVTNTNLTWEFWRVLRSPFDAFDCAWFTVTHRARDRDRHRLVSILCDHVDVRQAFAHRVDVAPLPSPTRFRRFHDGVELTIGTAPGILLDAVGQRPEFLIRYAHDRLLHPQARQRESESSQLSVAYNLSRAEFYPGTLRRADAEFWQLAASLEGDRCWVNGGLATIDVTMFPQSPSNQRL